IASESYRKRYCSPSTGKFLIIGNICILNLSIPVDALHSETRFVCYFVTVAVYAEPFQPTYEWGLYFLSAGHSTPIPSQTKPRLNDTVAILA
uniref:Uncharacterized protein n=1 Tax=Anopheles minimus TaxID=112268 RepID=A0A182WNL1_9DIPT